MKTPITDANTRKVTHSTFYNGRGYQAEIDVVDASVAQQLETELNEARAEITRLKGELISQAYQDLGVVEYGIGVTSQPESGQKAQNAEMLAMLKKADELIDDLIIDNTVSKSIYDEREELRALIKKVEGENEI